MTTATINYLLQRIVLLEKKVAKLELELDKRNSTPTTDRSKNHILTKDE